MKYFLSILLLIAMMLVIGCSTQSKTTQNEAKVPVTVTEVKLGKVEKSSVYNGDIQAELSVKVYSKIPDRIETFYVDEGAFVSKGKAIAKIQATTIEQAVRQAEAGLNALRAQESNLSVEYERMKRLFNEGAVSRQQFDALETQYKAIKAQVEQAEAGLASARASLQDATITAPISGIIGKRYLEAGDMAAPSLPLVEIVQMDRVKVVFDVTESDLQLLKVGQPAVVRVKGGSDRSFEGRVYKISPILDPMTRMASVEVLVENHDRLLKPGMFAQVIVTTGVLDNVITIPRYAALENTSLVRVAGKDEVVKKYNVFVVENDHAVQRELDVAYVNHVAIAVKSGLSIGEKLVVQGQNNLRDGAAVAIIEEEK